MIPASLPRGPACIYGHSMCVMALDVDGEWIACYGLDVADDYHPNAFDHLAHHPDTIRLLAERLDEAMAGEVYTEPTYVGQTNGRRRLTDWRCQQADRRNV